MRNDSFTTEINRDTNILILQLFMQITIIHAWRQGDSKWGSHVTMHVLSNKYLQSEGGPSAMLCGLQLLGTQDPPALTLSTGDTEYPPWAILEDNIKTA